MNLSRFIHDEPDLWVDKIAPHLSVDDLRAVSLTNKTGRDATRLLAVEKLKRFVRTVQHVKGAWTFRTALKVQYTPTPEPHGNGFYVTSYETLRNGTPQTNQISIARPGAAERLVYPRVFERLHLTVRYIEYIDITKVQARDLIVSCSNLEFPAEIMPARCPSNLERLVLTGKKYDTEIGARQGMEHETLLMRGEDGLYERLFRHANVSDWDEHHRATVRGLKVQHIRQQGVEWHFLPNITEVCLDAMNNPSWDLPETVTHVRVENANGRTTITAPGCRYLHVVGWPEKNGAPFGNFFVPNVQVVVKEGAGNIEIVADDEYHFYELEHEPYRMT